MFASWLRSLTGRKTNPITGGRRSAARNKPNTRPGLEPLESRLAPATLHWQGDDAVNPTLWSVAANWQENQTPVTDDEVVFDTATPAFAGFTSVNDVPPATLASLAGMQIVDASAAGTFFIDVNDIGLTGNITSDVTVGSFAIIDGAGDTITLGAPVSISSTSGSLQFDPNIDLNSHGLSVDGAGGTSLPGTITGAGTLAKNGTGGLSLSGSSDYTGLTTLNSGITVLGSAMGLGAAAAGNETTVNAGATLALGLGSPFSVAESLTLNGSGAQIGFPALDSATSGITLTGTVTLGSNASIGAQGGTWTISGAVGNGFGLTKTGTGTVTLTGGLTATDLTVQAGTLNVSASDVDINGNVSIQGTASLTAPGAGNTFNIAGNFSNAATSTFTHNGGTVTFDGTGTQTLDSGGDAFNNVTHSGTGTLQLLTSNLNITGNLTNTAGVFDLAGRNLTVTGTVSIANGSTLQLQGNETVSLVNDVDTGTWRYVGDTTAGPLTIKDFGAVDYWNLWIDSGPTTMQVGAALDVARELTMFSGTFDANGQTVDTGTNTPTRVYISNSTYLPSTAQQTFNGGLILESGTGAFTSVANSLVDCKGDVALNANSGTLTAPGATGTFTVSGNWFALPFASFNPNGGTVTLDGTNQTIFGSTTFNNLTKTVAAADTLTFEAGDLPTVTGMLTLQGAAGNLLSLRSSTPGTQWSIDPQGSRSVAFVDVQDSNNVNAAPVAASFSVDSGNNINWSISAAGATLHWQGDDATNPTLWSVAANWLENTSPVTGDTVVFDTNTTGFAGFASTNDIAPATLASLAGIQIVDASAAGEFDIDVNNIGLTGNITSNVTVAAGSTQIGGVGDTITLAAPVTITTTAGQLAFFANIDLNGQGLTVDGAETTEFSNTMTGAGSLTKNGTGFLFLPLTADYTGLTTLNSGVAFLDSPTGLGATGAGNGTTVNAGATLRVTGGATPVAEGLTLNGSGVGGIGALNNTSSDHTLTGPVTLGSDVSIGADTGTTLTISGAVSGGFGLTKTGPGTLTLSGGLTVQDLTAQDGSVDVSASNVDLNGNVSIQGTASLTAPGAGNTFNIAGNFSNAATSTFTANGGTVTFDGTGTQTLDSGGDAFNNVSHTGAGTLQLVTNGLVVGGTFDNTAGIFDANGQSTTVTGLTTISGGEYLASTAQQTFNGGLTVSGAGMFTGGAGSLIDVNGNVSITGGTVTAPGSAGMFTVSGNWSQTGGAFIGNGGTVTFDLAAGTQTIDGGIFDNLSHTAAGTVQLVSDLVVNIDLTNSSGTFDLNGHGLIVIGTVSVANGSTIQLQGGEAVTLVNGNDVDTGTWRYMGDTMAGPLTVLDFGAVDYWNLVIMSGPTTLQAVAALDVARALTVSSGTFDANGQTVDTATNTAAATTVSGGTYLASTAQQTFNGGLIVNGGTFIGANGPVDVNGNVNLITGQLTAPSGLFTVAGNWSRGSATFNTGTNTVTFDGTGTQTLDQGAAGGAFFNLSHTGTSTLQLINNQLLVIGSLLNSAGTFDANGLDTGVVGLTTVSGSTYQGTNATHLLSGGLTIVGAGSSVTATAGGVLFVSVGLSMTGGSIATGAGILDLNSNVTTFTAATMASISGNIDLVGAVRSFTLADGAADPDLSISASIGNGGLTKLGPGKLQLTGSNSYAGATTVTAGTLQVDGVQPNSSVLINGGTLGGNGTVGPITITSGQLSPGASPGIMNSGDTNFNGGTFDVELDGTLPGSQYDLLNVTGMVSFGPANTTLNILLGFDAPVGTQFLIVNNDLADPITPVGGPFFNGLGEGATFTSGGAFPGRLFTITYVGGSNANDIVLTRANTVPTSPTLTPNPGATIDEALTTFSLDGSFTDADLLDSHTVTIDWGDGTSETFVIAPPGTATRTFNRPHVYADDPAVGTTYTISVSVTDSNGDVSDADPETAGNQPATTMITVNNVAPALTVVGNQNIAEGAALDIIPIATFIDPGFRNTPGGTDETFTFTIIWGDGSANSTGTATVTTVGSSGVPTAGSFAGSHIYPDDGTYTVMVTVTDDDGDSDTEMFMVTVTNVNPTLTVVGNQTINEGQALNITNLGVITDPGFDNPAGTPPTTEAFPFSIDWGDGSTDSTGTATIDDVGGPGDLTDASFDGTHTYADNGSYLVNVTVTDDNGGTDTASFTVTVNNVNPTLTLAAGAAADPTIAEGSTLSFPPLATFTDPGFDNPAGTPPTTETFTFSINWGDSIIDTGTATVTTPGSMGTPTSGNFDRTHVYADNGVYTVTVRVTDDDGGFDEETFTVTVTNVAPTVNAGPNQAAAEGAVVNLAPAMFNDRGTRDTHTATINWGDGTTSTGTVIETPFGPPGSTAGMDGTVAGSHVYADNGIYTVTVTVRDDEGSSTSDTLTVTVTNVAPTVDAGPNQIAMEGSVVNLAPATFNDLGTGDTHTAGINWGDGTTTAGSVTEAPFGPPGSTAGANGTVAASHVYSDNGVFTVTVTVTDDDGSATSDTFTVTVANVAPTVDAGPNQVTVEGTAISLAPATFNDRGTTDTHTATINWGDGTTDTGVVTETPFGPPGATAGLDGMVAGSHTYGDNGSYTVTVTVTDDDGAAASDTFTVTVLNVRPTLTVVPNQTVTEGALLTQSPIGTFTDPGFRNTPGGTDETFTFSINWGDNSPIDMGAATVTTVGAPGTLTSGSFNGSHVYADNGSYLVTVTLTDDDGGSDIETFTVTVTNVAPTVVAGPNQTTTEGTLISLAPATFNDLGSRDTHTATINWGDGNLTSGVVAETPFGPPGSTAGVDGTVSGSHIYGDNGTYVVTVTVQDDDGAATSDTLTVTVANANPSLALVPPQAVTEGQLLNLPSIGIFNDVGFRNVPGGTDETFTYGINWGDTIVDSGTATVTIVGSPGVVTAGQIGGAHVYADNGTFTVTVSVTDDDGGSDTETFMVTVDNVAPTVLAGPDQATREGDSISLPPAAFNDLGTLDTHRAAIDWGDGTVDTGIVIEAPFGPPGSTLGLDGTVAGSHVYADNGTYTVTVSVQDDDLATTSDSFIVTVANVPPAVQTLSLTPAAINEHGETTLAGTFTDPSGNVDTYTVVINWGNGETETLALAADQRSFSATHRYRDDNPGGTASDTYKVTATVIDKDGDRGSSIVAAGDPRAANIGDVITVNNVAPAITGVGLDSFAITESQTVRFFTVFTDPGTQDPHTVTINWGDGSPNTTLSLDTTAAIAAQMQTMGVTDVPLGAPNPPSSFVSAVIDANTNTSTITISTPHQYVDNLPTEANPTITVTVADDDTGTHTSTTNLQVANDTPRILSVVPSTTDLTEGDPFTLAITFDDLGKADSHLASIFWGDGRMDENIVLPAIQSPTTFTHTHIYESGDPAYEITIFIMDKDGAFAMYQSTAGLPGQDPFTVTVHDFVSVNVGSDITVTVGSGGTNSINNQLLATFTDRGQPEPLDNYVVTVEWGDGTSNSFGDGTGLVQVAFNSATQDYEVRGTHLYQTGGRFTLEVSVFENTTRLDGTFLDGPFTAEVTLNFGSAEESFLFRIFQDVVSAEAQDCNGGKGIPVEGNVFDNVISTSASKVAGTSATDPNFGAIRTSIVQQVLGSREFLTRIVRVVYCELLGRDPVMTDDTTADAILQTDPLDPTGQRQIVVFEDSGAQAWVEFLAQNGSTAQLRAIVASSTEFMSKFSELGTYINGLYEHLLHRPVDAAGFAYWAAQFRAGATPTQVAVGIVESEEGKRHTVDRLFQQYLGRSISAAEFNTAYFVESLKANKTERQFIQDIVLTQEFDPLNQ